MRLRSLAVVVLCGCPADAPGGTDGDDTGGADTTSTTSVSASASGSASSASSTTPGTTTLDSSSSDSTTDPFTSTSTTGATGGTSTGSTSGGSSSSSTGEAVCPGTGGGVGTCGNGVVNVGEQCDGDDLQGFDCASLGLGEGLLCCDPTTCTFDTTACDP